MGLFDEKRSAATLIIRRMKGSDDFDNLRADKVMALKPEVVEAPQHEGAELDTEMGCEMAVTEMMSALKSDDVKKFKRALEAFLDLKDMKEDAQESESDE